MKDAPPHDFLPDGTHWADVLGCDMRAQITEIQRAARRRTDELLAGPLQDEALAEKINRISDALTIATHSRRTSTRGKRGIGNFPPDETPRESNWGWRRFSK